MKKCEFCSFGNEGSIVQITADGEKFRGEYGRQIFVTDDFTKDATHLYESFNRIVKTKNEYFLESNVEGLMSYALIKFCPICGRKLYGASNGN